MGSIPVSPLNRSFCKQYIENRIKIFDRKAENKGNLRKYVFFLTFKNKVAFLPFLCYNNSIGNQNTNTFK